MSDCCEQSLELRALAMRVAALEDNVAFLEQWCEAQFDRSELRLDFPHVHPLRTHPLYGPL